MLHRAARRTALSSSFTALQVSGAAENSAIRLRSPLARSALVRTRSITGSGGAPASTFSAGARRCPGVAARPPRARVPARIEPLRPARAAFVRQIRRRFLPPLPARSVQARKPAHTPARR